jgi:plasmid maintenance system antidote protein VapI
MGVIVTILQGEQLIMSSAPIAIDLALKLKALFSKVDGVSFNMQAVSDQAIQADDDTIKIIEDWKTANGLA